MTFGSLGYGPRAQSVLHCHGVLALRHGTEAVQNESRLHVWHSGLRAASPERRSLDSTWTEAVQNESRPQEDTSKVAVGSAETQEKSRFGASFLVGSESDVWQSGIRAAGPIRPSLPWCFSPATRSLDSSLDRSGAERKPAPGGHEQGGSWQCRNAGKVKVWS